MGISGIGDAFKINFNSDSNDKPFSGIEFEQQLNLAKQTLEKTLGVDRSTHTLGTLAVETQSELSYKDGRFDEVDTVQRELIELYIKNNGKLSPAIMNYLDNYVCNCQNHNSSQG